jgi:hypothetical protein
MSRHRALAVATLIVGSMSPAAAQTVDVCKQVGQVINHPATYVAEKIQKCAFTEKKKRGLRRILRVIRVATHPECCAPSWVAHPHCYVLNNKKVKDAWTEVKQSVEQCNPKDLKLAAREFVSWNFDPRYVFFKELKPVLTTLDVYFAVVRNQTARKIPEPVKKYMREYRVALGLPFTEADIENARWIRHDHKSVKPFAPRNPERHDSITWGNLILTGPQLLGSEGCEQLDDWAHELTHVKQYREKGFELFVTDYVQKSAVHKYEDIPSEVEGFATGQKVAKYCKEKGHGADIKKIR